MGKKIFSMYADAIDKNGEKHIVTVVGKYVKKNEFISVAEQKTINGKDGLFVREEKKRVRKLILAYSICHPTDTFNEAEGIRVALRRMREHPIGTLTTEDKTMLCKDMCNILVFNELKHIINHIDDYIVKKENETEYILETEEEEVHNDVLEETIPQEKKEEMVDDAVKTMISAIEKVASHQPKEDEGVEIELSEGKTFTFDGVELPKAQPRDAKGRFCKKE